MRLPLYLIGFMGSGKSYLGKRWAEALHLPFLDLDTYIEQRTQKTINELFDFYGEVNFRAFETQMLKEITKAQPQTIIACGGGAACFNNNILFMNEQGTTIYLQATANTLVKRLENEKMNRPLIKNISTDALPPFIVLKLEQREVFYLQAQKVFSVESLLNMSLEEQIALIHE